MTVCEVFSKISGHQQEGCKFHSDMIDYFDFLGLRGFKRVQEYHFFEETIGMEKTRRYFMSHFNKLIEPMVQESLLVIPDSWYRYNKLDVDGGTKKQAIKDAYEKWYEWETRTRDLYKEWYCELWNLKEIDAADEVEDLIEDVTEELKRIDRMRIDLKSIDYDLCTIYELQDSLHKKYKDKMKELKA